MPDYWPYGIPGSLLWVRETFLLRGAGTHCVYRADMDPVEAAGFGAMYGGWTPSIFMPRKWSRITLEVTDVRVERLQEITLDDARAEGIPQLHGEAVTLGLIKPFARADGPDSRDLWDNRTSVENYWQLWDHLNAKRAPWSQNPLVWVLEFKR